MEFLVRGATQFGEPGVFMAFEETPEELAQNVRSLGFDLDELVRQKKLVVDFVRVERSEIEETGDYDLEGLFVRLGHAIDTIGAKRVVLDTIETLFAACTNTAILRAELRRLFRWLKDKGVTAVITGERGEGTLTRHGLEEYVSDCVILLDHRVIDQVSTRRLRVVKYRGTRHGTNEYPFLIDEDGISVLPITSLRLAARGVRANAISTGVPRLDAMLGGKGFYRGSSVLVSGTAGTGKTSLAAHFVACGLRARRALPVLRVRGVAEPDRAQHALDRRRPRAVGRRRACCASTPRGRTLYGLEMHLATFHKLVQRVRAATSSSSIPIGSLDRRPGTRRDATAMLMRLIDFLKAQRHHRRSSPT